jgi:hypothetical protein
MIKILPKTPRKISFLKSTTHRRADRARARVGREAPPLGFSETTDFGSRVRDRGKALHSFVLVRFIGPNNSGSRGGEL